MLDLDNLDPDQARGLERRTLSAARYALEVVERHGPDATWWGSAAARLMALALHVAPQGGFCRRYIGHRGRCTWCGFSRHEHLTETAALPYSGPDEHELRADADECGGL